MAAPQQVFAKIDDDGEVVNTSDNIMELLEGEDEAVRIAVYDLSGEMSVTPVDGIE